MRLLSVIIAFALLLMPVGMIGGEAAAMTHTAASAVGHCADLDGQSGDAKRQPDASLHCLGCAAIPSTAAQAAAGLLVRAPLGLPAEAQGRAGLAPEAATPPPRSF